MTVKNLFTQEIKKKRKKKLIIHKRTCNYCRFFLTADDRTGMGEDHSRFCRPKDDFIGAYDEACDDFSAHMRFWCSNLGYWMDKKACLMRNHEIIPECSKCRQLPIVRNIVEEEEAIVVEVNEPVVKRKVKKLKRIRR